VDQHILDLPLCRLRQAVEAALHRRKVEQMERIRLTEWQARTTCAFIAAQAGLLMELKQGQKNPMLDDPRFQKMVLADPVKGIEASNPSGSFEALMAGWGQHPSHGQAFDTSAAQQG
jgi:hypothetical protein